MFFIFFLDLFLRINWSACIIQILNWNCWWNLGFWLRLNLIIWNIIKFSLLFGFTFTNKHHALSSICFFRLNHLTDLEKLLTRVNALIDITNLRVWVELLVEKRLSVVVTWLWSDFLVVKSDWIKASESTLIVWNSIDLWVVVIAHDDWLLLLSLHNWPKADKQLVVSFLFWLARISTWCESLTNLRSCFVLVNFMQVWIWTWRIFSTHLWLVFMSLFILVFKLNLLVFFWANYWTFFNWFFYKLFIFILFLPFLLLGV